MVKKVKANILIRDLTRNMKSYFSIRKRRNDLKEYKMRIYIYRRTTSYENAMKSFDLKTLSSSILNSTPQNSDTDTFLLENNSGDQFSFFSYTQKYDKLDKKFGDLQALFN